MADLPPSIASLKALTNRYRVLLCDVWGVIHNGVTAFPEAVAALDAARARGVVVIIITNAPRSRDGVITQLATLRVPETAWDRVVTSGDVTRELIRSGPRKVFHIGPVRDYPIYDGLDIKLVEEFEASSVVCTSLSCDEIKTPDDYTEMLRRLRARDLPLICANPDIAVEYGNHLIWCAGALASDYGQLGGRTLFAGKPHRPIYEAALQAASEVLGHDVSKSEALAIGDNMVTDVKGAIDNGIDALYISGGIHACDYGERYDPDPVRLAKFFDKHGYAPVATIPRLR